MNKVDCVILGGGNLVVGKGKRSKKLKGNEEINGKQLGSYTLSVLSQHRDRINNIVYVGDKLDDDLGCELYYVTPESGRGFLGSLKSARDTLRTINGTKSKITLIICGDLPLIGDSQLDMILDNLDDNKYLTLFGVNNDTVQDEYPDYNKNKRYLELQEQDFIFGNAFGIDFDGLDSILEKVINIKNKKNLPKELLDFIHNIGINNFLILIKILLFGNIKLFDGRIPKILKKVKKPREDELISLIESTVGKGKVSIIDNAPSELVIDYDRLYQLGFFERQLKLSKYD